MIATDRQPPVGQSERGSFVDFERFEEDLVPVTALALDPEQGFWFWQPVVAEHSALGVQTFSLELPGVATTHSPATLGVTVQGVTQDPTADGDSPEYRAELRLNGAIIGEIAWHGQGRQRLELSLAPSALRTGVNQITVTGLRHRPDRPSAFYVDALDLRRARLYQAHQDQLTFSAERAKTVAITGFSQPQILLLDITDPLTPRQILGGQVEPGGVGQFQLRFKAQPQRRYFSLTLGALRAPVQITAYAPTDLQASHHAVDHLIIAPAELMGPAAQLAAYRQSQGLRAQAVDLADIYREFNQGVASPWAIHRLLVHAATHWARSPRFVLLLGAGHFDYHERWGLGGNLIPPLLVTTPWGLYAADGELADLDRDHRPDVMLGRLPVLTASEATDFIAKLIAYESAGGGSWQQQAILVADARDPRVGSFADDSEKLLQALPPRIQVERVYLDVERVATARARLLNTWQAGAFWVNYVGHGGLDTWSGQRLLTLQEVASLANGSRLPWVSSLSCNIGRFEVPGFECLACALVRHSAGGAVAALAPSGQSSPADAARFGQFLAAAVDSATSTTLGEVVLHAFLDWAAGARNPAALRTYHLFGDPATQLQRPLK